MLKIAWTMDYAHPLPRNHRFPMSKYELLPEQLLYEGTISESNLFAPGQLEERHLLAVHDAEYWKRLSNLELTPREQRRTGFPHSEQLIKREITIMEGTRMAADFALEYGAAMNIAGGTHHAYTNRGEGFCLLNDIAIAAHYLLDTGKVKQVLVVDVDVHQGNGTAQIFQDRPEVFTFSMHGAKNYPHHKETSDRDIPLPDGTEDAEYLRILRENLDDLLETVEPDFIFFQSGVDVLASDRLGRLALTPAGCKERDRIVWETCKENQIPVVASMGGGYSQKLTDIVDAHANTYRLAQEIFF